MAMSFINVCDHDPMRRLHSGPHTIAENPALCKAFVSVSLEKPHEKAFLFVNSHQFCEKSAVKHRFGCQNIDIFMTWSISQGGGPARSGVCGSTSRMVRANHRGRGAGRRVGRTQGFKRIRPVFSACRSKKRPQQSFACGSWPCAAPMPSQHLR